MGGSTKLQQEAIVEANAKFLERFAKSTKELKAKLSAPIPPVSEDFKEFEGFFVRPKETFQLKTKSKNRNKQRMEFVRHVFHVFPVPVFMAQAWETHVHFSTKIYEEQKTASKGWVASHLFKTKVDYRLWYICMATGGSFYKEYGKALFTKKESHIFLNCQHEDLTIDQAIVYAIAYAESENMGKALRIAKSKINTFQLTEFWREVVRFFARQEPDSKEEIDDIVDYIRYKQQETPEFTIIGKGHTLKSLKEKVEHWHQDLRRLKLIGDSVWEGIPVNDKEYSKKNFDGTIDYWKFTQIKDAKSLQKEGNAMRHCVFGYKRQCIAGECSIWSVTFNENKKLTVEVRGRYAFHVAQVRGLANRIARPDEKDLVKRWARDVGFQY